MKMDYVCFNITSLCNMKCPYCYRVGTTLGSIGLEKAKKYIDLLFRLGCRTINVTGGEPLLNVYWREIIEYCKKKGFYVILSTNGTALNVDDSALTNIDVLSIPLDGPIPEINEKTRAKDHFDSIVRLLNNYNRGNYNFLLKVNTVITKYNIASLHMIQDLLRVPRVVWKLFELRKKGTFYEFPDSFIAQSDEIARTIHELEQNHSIGTMCFMGTSSNSSVTTVNSNYVVLNFNGDVFLASEDEDTLLTNLDAENAIQILDSLDISGINNQYQEELHDDFISD